MLRLGQGWIPGARGHLPQDTVGTGDLADVPRGKLPCKVWGTLEMTRLLSLASRKRDSSSVR